MRRLRIYLVLASVTLAATLQVAAQNDWRTTRQARTVVNRLITNTNNFQRQVERDRYPWDNDRSDERLSNQVSALENGLQSLKTSLNKNGNPTDELSSVLTRASRINMLLDRNQVNSRATQQWTRIRTDLNTLAGYYNMAWNWNDTSPNTNFPGSRFNRLSGTYRLNTSLSDDTVTIINRTTGTYRSNERENLRRGLERRLQQPEMIVIDRNGRSITMASSLQPQVTFDVDGVARTETNTRGRAMTTTVTPTGDGFTVNYAGDRMNDFKVTFDPNYNGRLRVTRQIYLENRNQTVTVSSVYDRISERPDWTAIRTSTTPPYYGNTGAFYVPNGVQLTATLRNMLSTRATQNGDRFTMDVVSPSQYRGAVIEGHVTDVDRSGRFSGRANLQLDFDTITVNGRQYAFAGMVESVTNTSGDSVSINNEGAIRDSNQTTKTVTRAGVGALLGAIIGAVAGGGEGAAIGAGVGAGAGAGSVLIGGRDNIELGRGSSFRIVASAPANIGSRR